MIHVSEIGPTEQIFTHIDPDTGETICLAIDRLKADKRLLMKPVGLCPVSMEFAEFCIRERGVEVHRVARVLAAYPVYDPVLFAAWGDGSHLLIDGVHRYVACATHGSPTIKGKIVPLTVWRSYRIDLGGAHPSEGELKEMFSGIL